MMVIRLYSVDVSYPPGLEDLINAFKLCATVRLFLQVIILSYFSYFFTSTPNFVGVDVKI